MAFGILTAGFLKGAADATTRTITAAREADRESEKLREQRQFERDMMKARQQFTTSEREASQMFQRGESIAQAADQEARDIRLNQQQVERDLALSADAEFRAIAQSQRQEESALRQARIARGDKLLEDLAVQKRADELNRKIKTGEIDLSKGFVYPAGDISVIKPATTKDGTEGALQYPMYTRDWAVGPDGKPPIVTLRDVDDDLAKSDAAVDRVFAEFETKMRATGDLPKIIELHKTNANKAPLDNVISHLSKHAGSKMRGILDLSKSTDQNLGQIFYANPIMKFGIDKLLPNKQDQLYIFENLFGRLVPEIKDLGRQAVGLHPDIELGFRVKDDDIFVDFPTDIEALSWATESGGKVKEIFEDRLQKLSEGGRTPMAVVMRAFYRPGVSDEQLAAGMDAFLKMRKELTGTYVDVGKDRISFKADFDNVIMPFLENGFDRTNGATIKDSIEEGVDHVDLLLATSPITPLEVLHKSQGTGRPKTENDLYISRFGIDREAAAQKAGFAQDTLKLIQDIREAKKDGGLLGAGGRLITLTTGVEAFFQGVGEIATRLRNNDKITMDASVAKRLGELYDLDASGQPKYRSILNSDQVTAQGKLNYLIEALAFAIAGSLQGGAKGNNISNQDIQNVKNGLNMGSLLSAESTAEGTLNYLEKKMNAVYAINNRFATANNIREFRAAYAYNHVMGLSYIGPEHNRNQSTYDFFYNDPRRPRTEEEQNRRGQASPTSVGELNARPTLNELLGIK